MPGLESAGLVEAYTVLSLFLAPVLLFVGVVLIAVWLFERTSR